MNLTKEVARMSTGGGPPRNSKYTAKRHSTHPTNRKPPKRPLLVNKTSSSNSSSEPEKSEDEETSSESENPQEEVACCEPDTSQEEEASSELGEKKLQDERTKLAENITIASKEKETAYCKGYLDGWLKKPRAYVSACHGARLDGEVTDLSSVLQKMIKLPKTPVEAANHPTPV